MQLAIGGLRQLIQNLNVLTGNLEEYPSLLFLGNAPKPAHGKRKEDE